MAVICHADSWVDLEHLGQSRPYRPTYEESVSLGPTHRRLLTAPLRPDSVAIDIGIPGALRREDAAKLYELTYFGVGDALVLGSGHGLAAAISAQAIFDSGRPAVVAAVEADPRRMDRARANLAALNLDQYVEFVRKQPVSYCNVASKQGRQVGVVFCDDSTSYADIRAICKSLSKLVTDEGFVLFHDFNDRRNKDAKAKGGYGVYSGVIDGLPVPPFAFFGSFGCTGVYRRDAAFPGSSTQVLPILGVQTSR